MKTNSIFFSAVAFLIFVGCQSQKKPLKAQSEFQTQQNSFFKDASNSPLKPKDLKVFEGLGSYRKMVKEGVLESAIKSKLSLYNKSTNFKNIKKKFVKWGYKIESIKEFHKNNPERNLYFSNNNFHENINFNSPSEKNLRLFNESSTACILVT